MNYFNMIKYAGVVVLCGFLYYLYTDYQNTFQENEILKKNISTVKENQVKTIESYEQTISTIRKTISVGSKNQESKNYTESVNTKLEAIKEEFKNETSNNTNFIDFTF